MASFEQCAEKSIVEKYQSKLGYTGLNDCEKSFHVMPTIAQLKH